MSAEFHSPGSNGLALVPTKSLLAALIGLQGPEVEKQKKVDGGGGKFHG